MPRLSIVIPVLGDPQQLDDTLVSILQNRPCDCEILVVHNQPYGDPYDLGREVRFIEAGRDSGLVDCLNLGVTASRAPVVHLLACGVEVASGWAEAALPHFRRLDVAAVAAVVLNRNNPRKIVSAGFGYRSEGTAWRLGQRAAAVDVAECAESLCGPDILAAFYRKSAFEAVGGLTASVGDELAGVDLALSLLDAGFCCALEPQCVAHVDAAKIWDGCSFRRGYNAERLFWRWASTRSWLPSLARHIALLAGQCAIGFYRPSRLVQLLGRACGMLGAMYGRRSAGSLQTDSVERPSVVVASHLSVARRDRRPSSRAA